MNAAIYFGAGIAILMGYMFLLHPMTEAMHSILDAERVNFEGNGAATVARAVGYVGLAFLLVMIPLVGVLCLLAAGGS